MQPTLHCRFFIALLLICTFSYSQKNSRLIDSILNSDSFLKKIAVAKKKHKLQIIYTQINRNADNFPSFKNYPYALDSLNYFYPASTVKLPCAIFALEKLNYLKIQGLNKTTYMQTDSAYLCQKKFRIDSSAQNGLPSIEHYIKKMFLVSDNNAYSRLFEFLTPMQINQGLRQLGHPTARIVHRLDPACVKGGNKYFNPITFLNDAGDTLYTQMADSLQEEFKMPFKNLNLGRNIYNKKKKLISEKKDFSKSNYLPLNIIHQTLRNLVFWDYLPENKRFNLSKDDQQFLVKYLGMYPKESDYPKYDTTIFIDSFKKYFIYGSSVKHIETDSLRIFNIVGRAYGFQIDCAYIVDFQSKIEFMLSTVIYTNSRNSFGSGKYEYDSIGLPFLKELSLALYRFEKNRNKKYLPNLNAFNFYKK